MEAPPTVMMLTIGILNPDIGDVASGSWLCHVDDKALQNL